MQEEKRSLSHHDRILQQNKLYYAKQKLKYKSLFSDLQYNKQELPEIEGKYNGYMQLFKRKLGQNEPNQYFSSTFLSQLKQKRNNMFGDEIIQKLVKEYGLEQYGSSVQWRKIASNGIDLSKTKFMGNWQIEIQDYRTITDRMVGKSS